MIPLSESQTGNDRPCLGYTQHGYDFVDENHFALQGSCNDRTESLEEPIWTTQSALGDFDAEIFNDIGYNPWDYLQYSDDVQMSQSRTETSAVGTVRGEHSLSPIEGHSQAQTFFEFGAVIEAPVPLPSQKLKAWAAQNPEILYPDNKTKKYLAESTGLELKSVSTWFANYRQRVIKPSWNPQQVNDTKVINTNQSSVSSWGRWTSEAFEHGTASQSNLHLLSDRVNAASTPRTSLSLSNSNRDCRELQSESPTKLNDLNISSLFPQLDGDFITVWRALLPHDHAYDLAYDLRAMEPLDVNDTSMEKSIFSEQHRAIEDRPCDSNRQEFKSWQFGPNATAAELISEYQSLRFTKKTSQQRQQSWRGEDCDQSLVANLVENSTYRGKISYPPQVYVGRRLSRKRSFRSVDSSACGQSDIGKGSGSSVESMSSANSYSSLSPRRGRRMLFPKKPQSMMLTPIKQESVGTPLPYSIDSNGIHYCRICSTSFTRHSSLMRHMRCLHAVFDHKQWTCRPKSASMTLVFDRNASACLCGCPAQQCHHRMFDCWGQETRDRTFHRIDNFRQHLRQTHRLGHVVDCLNLADFESTNLFV